MLINQSFVYIVQRNTAQNNSNDLPLILQTDIILKARKAAAATAVVVVLVAVAVSVPLPVPGLLRC